MPRSLLIWILCAAVALVGVAGTHEHFHLDHGDAAVEHGQPDGEHVADVHTALSADHYSSHEAEVAVDHDPDAKSAAKVFAAKLLTAIAFFLAFFGLLARTTTAFVRRWSSFVPPRSRGTFFLQPPSHAPPVAA